VNPPGISLYPFIGDVLMATPRKPIKSSMPPIPAMAAPSPAPAPAIVEKSEMKGSGKPKAPATAGRSPTYDEIAKRAFEIYASRGYAPGDQNADWLEAERQLKAGL